jgi:hypothetical protein
VLQQCACLGWQVDLRAAQKGAKSARRQLQRMQEFKRTVALVAGEEADAPDERLLSRIVDQRNHVATS